MGNLLTKLVGNRISMDTYVPCLNKTLACVTHEEMRYLIKEYYNSKDKKLKKLGNFAFNYYNIYIKLLFCRMSDFVYALRNLDLHDIWIDKIIFSYNGVEHCVGMFVKHDSTKAMYGFDNSAYETLEELINNTLLFDSQLNISILGVASDKYFYDVNAKPPYEIKCDIRKLEEYYDLIDKYE